jgi:hypothetical protein
MLNNYSGIRARAWCEACDKRWDARNAHAVGAQHARRYGHEVFVEEERTYSYNSPPRDAVTPTTKPA